MFELDALKTDINSLRRDIECIKKGTCCTASSSTGTLYTTNSVITNPIRNVGINQVLNFTDGTTVRHAFYKTGQLAIGVPTVQARLDIAGLTNGGSSASSSLTLRSLDQVKKHIFADDGYTASNVGGNTPAALSHSANIYHDHKVIAADAKGIGWKKDMTNGKTVASYNALGQTLLGIEVIGTGALLTTSEATPMVFVDNKKTNSKNNSGITATASNGNEGNAGVVGYVTESTPLDNLIYLDLEIGVRGHGFLDKDNSNALSHGGYFSAEIDHTTNRTNQVIIGVVGEAIGSNRTNSTNNLAIGGKFSTKFNKGTASGNRDIAILVPQTNNNGIVVFGMDNIANGRAMLEVRGDIETFGVGSGIIVNDTTNGNKYRIRTVNGAVQAIQV